MCGRFTLRTPVSQVAELFDVREPWPSLVARYNIAPTQDVLAVRAREETGDREFALLRWGLIPTWADDPKIGSNLINARSESIRSKPAFRHAFRQRRCLIPADGFYEWQSIKLPNTKHSRKQPVLIGLKENRLFAFAGLWERWRAPDGRDLETCSILTTDSNERLRDLHDRMPVILPPEEWSLWLDRARTADELQQILRPYPAEEMTLRAVDPRVNSPKVDDAACIESPVQERTLF